MRYLISYQHINKRLDPNFQVIDRIYNIKDRSTLHIPVANYTNKHVTFNKGQCIGHIETSLYICHKLLLTVSLQRMIDKHIQPDTFTPPLHTLPGDMWKSLNQLLETLKSQSAQDETSIGITHLRKMPIDTSNSEPVSQKPYPIIMKHYCYEVRYIKLLDAQVLCSSHSSLSAPIIVVPKGDGGKCLVINNRALNKVTQKFVLPMARVENNFSKLNGAKSFATLDFHAGCHHIPTDEHYYQNSLYISFWKI